MPVSASPVATRGTPTADATTSTGASLWSPSLPPAPTQGGGFGNETTSVVENNCPAPRPTHGGGFDGENAGVMEDSFSLPLRPTHGSGLNMSSEDASVLDNFSMRTATTSMCSHDTANRHVHVDLHSYGKQ